MSILISLNMFTLVHHWCSIDAPQVSYIASNETTDAKIMRCKMEIEMSKLSAAQVAKLTGKSKSTILRLYNKGKLSGQRQEDRSVLFDLTEVLRFFPEAKQETAKKDATPQASYTASNETVDTKIIALEKEIEVLKVRLEFTNKENQQLTKNNEEIKDEKKKLLDMLERKDLLLEDMHLKAQEKPSEHQRRLFGLLPPKK